jgi:hypothetical protein
MLCSGSDSTINCIHCLAIDLSPFEVETAWGFLNDMSMALAELLYCCTLSTARLVGQLEENIQLFLALKCQMESIVGAKSIWLATHIYCYRTANQPTKSSNNDWRCSAYGLRQLLQYVQTNKLWVIAFDRSKD